MEDKDCRQVISVAVFESKLFQNEADAAFKTQNHTPQKRKLPNLPNATEDRKKVIPLPGLDISAPEILDVRS
jgi:hypothetical protein